LIFWRFDPNIDIVFWIWLPQRVGDPIFRFRAIARYWCFAQAVSGPCLGPPLLDVSSIALEVARIVVGLGVPVEVQAIEIAHSAGDCELSGTVRILKCCRGR
jgi:hypothetical protein